MFTFLACCAIYGMMGGATFAIARKIIEYPDDVVEVALVVLWPVCLPGLIMWWFVTGVLGEEE